MWESVKSLLADFFEEHRMRKIGFIIGVLVGAAILIFGFFPTLFAFLCGTIGLYIGARFDEGDDLINRTLMFADKHLPEKLRRPKFF